MYITVLMEPKILEDWRATALLPVQSLPCSSRAAAPAWAAGGSRGAPPRSRPKPAAPALQAPL